MARRKTNDDIVTFRTAKKSMLAEMARENGMSLSIFIDNLIDEWLEIRVRTPITNS